MKKLLLFSLLCLLLLSMRTETTDAVYICTGPKAQVYHSASKCRGLNRFSGEIKAMSFEKVKKTRRACKICYKQKNILHVPFTE